MLLSITGAATGTIYTEYLSGGTKTVFKSEAGPARQGEKFVKVLRKLVGTQRGERTGILTVTYRRQRGRSVRHAAFARGKRRAAACVARSCRSRERIS